MKPIAVSHQIADPATFWASAQANVPNAPHGMRLVQCFVSDDNTQSTCLWHAPDAETLKAFVEPLVGHVSTNTYFEVNAASAMGLPA